MMFKNKIELPFNDEDYKKILSAYKMALLVSLGVLMFCLYFTYILYENAFFALLLGGFYYPHIWLYSFDFYVNKIFKSKDLKERIKIKTTLIVSSKKIDKANDDYILFFNNEDIDRHSIEKNIYDEVNIGDKVMVSYSKNGKLIFDMKYKQFQLVSE